MGTLAISSLTRNNFIRLEEERENKLKQLLPSDFIVAQLAYLPEH